MRTKLDGHVTLNSVAIELRANSYLIRNICDWIGVKPVEVGGTLFVRLEDVPDIKTNVWEWRRRPKLNRKPRRVELAEADSAQCTDPDCVLPESQLAAAFDPPASVPLLRTLRWDGADLRVVTG